MSTKTPKNLAASVRDRLRGLARQRKEELELVLTRYGLERLMYRLSVSTHRDDFVLKGAMLFTLWAGEPHRATRDLDLLGRGPSEIPRIEALFRDVCELSVAEDGVAFDPASVRGARIREDREYEGVRVQIASRIESARFTLQIDVGFGDHVIPQPHAIEYPVLLEPFPAPVLQAYPMEAVISEKVHAMVVLGMANSRMKDFYDVWSMAQGFELDGATLAASLRATFARRRTDLPTAAPLALSRVFFDDEGKRKQWVAFVRRAQLRREGPRELGQVIPLLHAFLTPTLEAAAAGRRFEARWDPTVAQWIPQGEATRDRPARGAITALAACAPPLG